VAATRFKTISSEKIIISEIEIELQRKRMKYLRIRILNNDGSVRVSAPKRVSMATITSFISSRISWIKSAQDKIRNRVKPAELQYISGEDHYFFGQKFTLELAVKGKAAIDFEAAKIILRVKENSTILQRQKLLENFYRAELQKLIPQYIAKLEPIMKVKVLEFKIKKMKTRWGTCNPRAKRIWLNLELAKKPLLCLEYIVTHEMVHLLERKHNKRFFSLMDRFMPNWRECKSDLKS